MSRRRAGAVALGAVAAVAAFAMTAFTATNTVPASYLSERASAVGANDLKPAECASVTLSTKVTGVGILDATLNADLALGGSGLDTISGLAGDDCVLGGGGNDTIDGGLGTDVCIGGPGTDTFLACETEIQ